VVLRRALNIVPAAGVRGCSKHHGGGGAAASPDSDRQSATQPGGGLSLSTSHEIGDIHRITSCQVVSGGSSLDGDRHGATQPISDVTAVACALRRAAAHLPLAYVCDHWARAIADAEAPSPFATSARVGLVV
jgi:hypothetical protein